MSRPSGSGDWSGDVGRVESFFEPGRLFDLRHRLELPAGGLRPDRAVIFVCGLTGTISRDTRSSTRPRVHPARAGDPRRARRPTRGQRQYVLRVGTDSTPVIDIHDRALIQQLRGRVKTALASHS